MTFKMTVGGAGAKADERSAHASDTMPTERARHPGWRGSVTQHDVHCGNTRTRTHHNSKRVRPPRDGPVATTQQPTNVLAESPSGP
jgi:hypothetical protein